MPFNLLFVNGIVWHGVYRTTIDIDNMTYLYSMPCRRHLAQYYALSFNDDDSTINESTKNKINKSRERCADVQDAK